MPVKFTVTTEGLDEIAEALKKAPETSTMVIKKHLNEMATQVDDIFRDKVPVWRGDLRDSVMHTEPMEVGDGIETLSGPTAEHAPFVNFGTRRHMPPVNAISNWAKAHGIEPWALAKSIARKGTKANPFLDRVSTRAAGLLEPRAQEMSEEIAERMLHG